MFAVATLDPSTLAIWFNPTLLSSAESAEICLDTLELSSGENLGAYLKYLNGLSRLQRQFSEKIASAIWHEKRHFLDLILTNYGAYRVRQFFVLACNAFPILKTLGSRVAFPFHVYIDPVKRRIAGVEPLASDIEKLFRELTHRRELFHQESKPIKIDGHDCEIGGDAQLEGLAFHFQLGANQYWLGAEGAADWQVGLGKAHLNKRYRWAEMIAHAHGLLPTKTVGGRELVDSTLLIAILLASLMMRAWGQEYNHTKLGAVNVLPPFARIRMLLDDLKDYPSTITSMSVRESWMLVNERCKKLFGRSAIDELEEDFSREAEWLEKLDQSDFAARAFGDFHQLRGKLISILKSSPEQILDLNEWSQKLLPRLRPLEIFANPSGVEGTPPTGMSELIGETGQSGTHWWWAALKTSDAGGLGFRDIEAWTFVIKYLAPLSKLILSGRQHEMMIGPELLSMEHVLSKIGKTIYFDRPYEYPKEDSDTGKYYEITSRTKFKCDFCSKEISRGAGELLGPWTIRRNVGLADCCIKGLGDGKLGLERFRKDWSPWHFCNECIQLVKSRGLLP